MGFILGSPCLWNLLFPSLGFHVGPQIIRRRTIVYSCRYSQLSMVLRTGSAAQKFKRTHRIISSDRMRLRAQWSHASLNLSRMPRISASACTPCGRRPFGGAAGTQNLNCLKDPPRHCTNEPLSKLLVYPLITAIVVPYIIRYITPFKEFRLWLT